MVLEPLRAGVFYPKEKEKLKKEISGMLKKAKSVKSNPRVLIVPHAGYKYSGSIAASAFKAASGTDPQHILILGPSHHVHFDGIARPSAHRCKTPLGEIEISQDLLKVASKHSIEYDPVFDAEHSTETQLPFIQYLFPKAKVLPIIVGNVDNKRFLQLLKATEKLKPLIIVSTNLSYHLPFSTAKKQDQQTIKDLESYSKIEEKQACAWQILTTICMLAKRHGWTFQQLRYGTSGKAKAIRDHVVGYLAAAFTAGDHSTEPPKE